MIRKSISKGYKLTIKLARGFLKCFDALTLIPYGKHAVFVLGAFLVFLKKVYSA